MTGESFVKISTFESAAACAYPSLPRNLTDLVCFLVTVADSVFCSICQDSQSFALLERRRLHEANHGGHCKGGVQGPFSHPGVRVCVCECLLCVRSLPVFVCNCSGKRFRSAFVSETSSASLKLAPERRAPSSSPSSYVNPFRNTLSRIE